MRRDAVHDPDLISVYRRKSRSIGVDTSDDQQSMIHIPTKALSN